MFIFASLITIALDLYRNTTVHIEFKNSNLNVLVKVYQYVYIVDIPLP